MKIAIVGLGYVGLPLALAFAEKGVEVVGIDTDPSKAILLWSDLSRGVDKFSNAEKARQELGWAPRYDMDLTFASPTSNTSGSWRLGS